MTGTWTGPHRYEIMGRWNRWLAIEEHTPKAERRDPKLDYCDVPKDRLAIEITTRNGMTVPIQLAKEDAQAVADVIRTMADRMEGDQ